MLRVVFYKAQVITVKPPVDSYVLRDVEGNYYLIIPATSRYWIERILRKLQGMREKDLKQHWRELERQLGEVDEH